MEFNWTINPVHVRDNKRDNKHKTEWTYRFGPWR
jgi:hypothetical protein